MIRGVLHSVTSRFSSLTFQFLDCVGIRGTEQEEGDEASAPWQSRVYRRFSAKFGNSLPYVIFGSVLVVLFIIAVAAETNEVDLRTEPVVSNHLRGTPTNHGNATIHLHLTKQSAPVSARQSSPRSPVAFIFSLLLSVMFWIVVVQICRYVQRAIISRSGNSSGTTVTRQREAMQMLTQLMQQSRAGPGSAMLSNRLRMALLERDFTGEDYEMLQALDDSPVPFRGLDQARIDCLPLHTVTQREITDAATTPGGAPTCNICLEPYDANEEIRTVPCMHQFHKHCIDTWLRDRAVCPVCKIRVQI
jgi:hypothetical protein